MCGIKKKERSALENDVPNGGRRERVCQTSFVVMQNRWEKVGMEKWEGNCQLGKVGQTGVVVSFDDSGGGASLSVTLGVESLPLCLPAFSEQPF